MLSESFWKLWQDGVITAFTTFSLHCYNYQGKHDLVRFSFRDGLRRDGFYEIYLLFDCKGWISLSLAKQTHKTSQLRGYRIFSDFYVMVVCVGTLGPKGFGFVSRGDNVIKRCDISSFCLSDLVKKDHETSYQNNI